LYTARAFFEPTSRGNRFMLEYVPLPGRPQRGIVVLLHAFAEEMNKCRRMAAVTARRLAAEGWRVTQFDLPGCGDSSGSFADADWCNWCDDAVEVVQKASQTVKGPLWLWGMRAGALLIPPVIAHFPSENVLLWQPALSGQQQLGQFLRLKAALSTLSGAERVSVGEIRARLASGTSEEVAGYTISPSLATGLDSARLKLPDSFSGRVVWFEVAPVTPAAVSPVAQSQCEAWRAAGIKVECTAVYGPPFWQTQEIAESPALVEATLSALRTP